MIRLILVVLFGSTGAMCLLGAASVVLWGPVLILSKGYGLEVQSNLWAYFGVPLVMICSSVMFYVYWVCLLGFRQALHNTR
ncbi:hypothetical protein R2R70_02225 [Cobetia sp. SIMBA_158]|uniref:hypothetical protein n=1 Tax=Cobetia sp. SIMBA_158 TaxID=3081617 RepID=UPI003981499E